MDTLNGFPVIAEREVSLQESLVICDRGRTSPDRYAVWRTYRTGDGTLQGFAGYYTSDLRKALDNMESR